MFIIIYLAELPCWRDHPALSALLPLGSLGAKDRRPEIDTSEVFVDFQWHVPADFQWIIFATSGV